MKLTVKDRIKIYILPQLIRVFLIFGINIENLVKISSLKKSIMLAQANELGEMKEEKAEKSQNIYAITILTGGIFMLAIEALLGLALKKRGHNVIFIIDDNALPIHESKKLGKEKTWDYQSYSSFIFASKFFKNLKLKYIPLSTFIGKEIDDFWFTKKGLNRYFKLLY